MASGTRSLISYDDIVPAGHPSPRSDKPPPTKKRKGNKHSKERNYNDSLAQNNTTQVSSAPSPEEDSELTHEERWDDSALIDAWNAATEEYEAYNGPDKGWKKEPIHKWYNIPKPKTDATQNHTTATNGHVAAHESEYDGEENDSHPLNFATFVPSHDPALKANPHAFGFRPEPASGSLHFASSAPDTLVSQDEAFARAQEASFWNGYWTALYYANTLRTRGQVAQVKDDVHQGEVDLSDENNENEEEDGDGDEGEWDEYEDNTFVSTQR